LQRYDIGTIIDVIL